jgi:hypothetical protein
MRLNSDPNFTNFILTFFSIVFGLVAAEYVVGWQVFLRRLRANPALSFHINFVMASVSGFCYLCRIGGLCGAIETLSQAASRLPY